MRFHYRHFWVPAAQAGRKLSVFRPVVPLYVLGRRGTYRFASLVDTGSDETLLPHSVADQVGIKLDGQERVEVMGVGEQAVSVTYAKVELKLQSFSETFQWKARAGFIEYANPRNEIIILGHKGCLEFFKLKFNGPAKEFEITPGKNFPRK